ncbi:hypothetical protein DL96DRAFT_1716840 [Flagelloscypha sp. PMI_526]|nr:hypothetical protein DL96DRAFT_1716840 [Flagelloscypha sp. PMI_526]
MLLLVLASFFALLIPSFVLAKTQYYLDDTNSTAWSLPGHFLRLEDSVAFNGSYMICGTPNADSQCSGNLTFRGSSVVIYGVAFEASTNDHCAIDFSWPHGKSTFAMKPALKNSHNLSYAHAGGFDPEEISSVSFIARRCFAAIDYAIVTVEDEGIPSQSSHPKSSIGAIVGGVVGGVGVLTLLMVGIWIKFRRHRVTPLNELTTPLHSSFIASIVYPRMTLNLEESQPEEGLDHMAYLPSSSTIAASYEDQATAIAPTPLNSLATLAREKQCPGRESYGVATRALLPSISGSDALHSSDRVSTTPEIDRPVSLNSNNPAVRARLAQLHAEIREIESRDALPPPY